MCKSSRVYVFDEALAARCLAWLEEEEKRAKKPTQYNYNQIIRSGRKSTEKLVAQLQSGKIQPDDFHFKFDDLIRDRHIKAAVMGRQRAGDLSDITDLDRLHGHAMADEDAQRLQKFINDIKDGRYGSGEDLDVAAVNRRAQMYIDKCRATANQGLALASPVDALFSRVLLGVEHCSTCPEKAMDSPYSIQELESWVGYPGDGKEECKTNCKCTLVREDGVVGFGFVS